MSTLQTTNLKNPSSGSNNIVLASGGDTTVTNNLTVSGTGNNSIAGTFQFNSGYGSVATAYGCRAWVNFNGTGTVAIRGSGNVSSITDNGTGDYTVNFTTAMADVNYAPVVSTSAIGGLSTTPAMNSANNLAEVAPTTSAFRFTLPVWNNTAINVDQKYISVAIFR
jgi:hypothetical protein